MRQRINLADKQAALELLKKAYTDGTDDETTSQLDSNRATRAECPTPVGENSPQAT